MGRGSARGSAVEGKLLGGESGSREPIFFEASGGSLRLGDKHSQINFHVEIKRHVKLAPH